MADERCICGKVVYATRKEARERLAYRSIEGGRENTVYPCPLTSAFHIGEERTRRQARKAHPKRYGQKGSGAPS